MVIATGVRRELLVSGKPTMLRKATATRKCHALLTAEDEDPGERVFEKSIGLQLGMFGAIGSS